MKKSGARDPHAAMSAVNAVTVTVLPKKTGCTPPKHPKLAAAPLPCCFVHLFFLGGPFFHVQYYFTNFFHRDEAFLEIEQLANDAISRLLSATPTDTALPGAAVASTGASIDDRKCAPIAQDCIFRSLAAFQLALRWIFRFVLRASVAFVCVSYNAADPDAHVGTSVRRSSDRHHSHGKQVGRRMSGFFVVAILQIV